MGTENKTLKLTVAAVMTALATVIYMLFPEIPLVAGIDYLKIDFSDLPAILSGFIAGPVSGIAVEVVKNLIHLTRTTTFGIGEVMNVGIGSVLIVSLCGFLKLFTNVFSCKKFNLKAYFPACACALVCTVFAGWILNAVFTPLYFMLVGIPLKGAAIWAGVIGSTLLNVFKAAINILPFYPVYFAVSKTFSKIHR